MVDLVIKPTTGSGNRIDLQDQTGGSVLTTTDSGATINSGVLFKGTLNSDTTFTDDAEKRVASAWIFFDGTSTVDTDGPWNGSYNVSSITDNGTGDYTITYTTAMANDDYFWTGTATYTTSRWGVIMVQAENRVATGSIRINTIFSSGNNGEYTSFDPKQVTVIVVGDQS